MGSASCDPQQLASVQLDSRGTWRSLRVIRQSLDADVADVHLDATDAQLLDVQLAGIRDVHSRSGGRWRSARLGPGAVSTTPPGKPSHLRWSSTTRPERVQQIRVLIPAATTTRVAQEVWPAGPPPEPPDALRFDDDVLRGVVVGLHHAASTGLPDIYAGAAAELLTVHLLSVHGSAPVPVDPGRDDPRVRDAIAYLHAHSAEPVTLADLAVAVGLSRYHLLRLFRRHTGTTPHRYLLGLRVEHARRLLERTDLPVGRVAHRVGFSDQSHLSQHFRRAAGTTPSRYRAEVRDRG